ncbi:hypothetical protein RI054_13g64870 [Pseudoscourfieldia marina]
MSKNDLAPASSASSSSGESFAPIPTDLRASLDSCWHFSPTQHAPIHTFTGASPPPTTNTYTNTPGTALSSSTSTSEVSSDNNNTESEDANPNQRLALQEGRQRRRGRRRWSSSSGKHGKRHDDGSSISSEEEEDEEDNGEEEEVVVVSQLDQADDSSSENDSSSSEGGALAPLAPGADTKVVHRALAQVRVRLDACKRANKRLHRRNAGRKFAMAARDQIAQVCALLGDVDEGGNPTTARLGQAARRRAAVAATETLVLLNRSLAPHAAEVPSTAAGNGDDDMPALRAAIETLELEREEMRASHAAELARCAEETAQCRMLASAKSREASDARAKLRRERREKRAADDRAANVAALADKAQNEACTATSDAAAARSVATEARKTKEKLEAQVAVLEAARRDQAMHIEWLESQMEARDDGFAARHTVHVPQRPPGRNVCVQTEEEMTIVIAEEGLSTPEKPNLLAVPKTGDAGRPHPDDSAMMPETPLTPVQDSARRQLDFSPDASSSILPSWDDVLGITDDHVQEVEEGLSGESQELSEPQQPPVAHSPTLPDITSLTSLLEAAHAEIEELKALNARLADASGVPPPPAETPEAAETSAQLLAEAEEKLVRNNAAWAETVAALEERVRESALAATAAERASGELRRRSEVLEEKVISLEMERDVDEAARAFFNEPEPCVSSTTADAAIQAVTDEPVVEGKGDADRMDASMQTDAARASPTVDVSCDAHAEMCDACTETSAPAPVREVASAVESHLRELAELKETHASVMSVLAKQHESNMAALVEEVNAARDQATAAVARGDAMDAALKAARGEARLLAERLGDAKQHESNMAALVEEVNAARDQATAAVARGDAMDAALKAARGEARLLAERLEEAKRMRLAAEDRISEHAQKVESARRAIEEAQEATAEARREAQHAQEQALEAQRALADERRRKEDVQPAAEPDDDMCRLSCESNLMMSFASGMPILTRSPLREERASSVLAASRADEVRASMEHLERSKRQEKLARQFAEQAARFEESLMMRVSAEAEATSVSSPKLPWDSAASENSSSYVVHRYI